MNSPIIIGAGIAGLSAANNFIDHGIKPIVIEADIIGRDKVCGEFFSPESLFFLDKWEIPFIRIKKGNFIAKNYIYSFNFPNAAGSISRSQCELLLAKRIVNNNGLLYTNTSVTEIINAKNKNENHIIKLSNGQTLETNNLVIATGKIFNNKLNEPKYVGIKAHFKNFNIPNELFMYMISGAYLGISYVDNSTINLCCLAKKQLVDNFKTLSDFMQFFFNFYPDLNKKFNNSICLFNDWLTAYVFDFGIKKIKNWPNCFFIGDAAALIYPASGNGLAMGLTSGIMASEYIISNSKKNFKKNWRKRYSKRIFYAKILHNVFMNPKISNIGFRLANLYPKMSKVFFKLTREKLISSKR